MKTILILISIVSLSSAGILSNLLSPAPGTKMDSVRIVLQMNLPVSIIGLTKSKLSDKQIDAHMLNCVGFGPSLQWQQWTGMNYTTFAVTVAALFFPQVDQDAFPWDVGGGVIVTAFGGYGIGLGYNAGLVQGKSSNRLVGMLIADVMPWKNK
jgi:hypothetical protein